MGTDTGHREADLAMSLLKTDLMLQENVFYLEDGLPTKEHADPWGKVQVFHEQSGWQTFPLNRVKELATHGYYAWTFTPEPPPPSPPKS
jgi:hypothetical protein